MRPIVFVLLAAVCFGTTGTAQALGPAADPLSVGAARVLIGGAALATIAGVLRFRRRRSAGRALGAASTRPGSPGLLGRTPAWLLVGIGAAGVFAYQPAFFAGTAANGVAVGTVVALGSAPVITGALDWAVTGRRPGGLWLLATAIATAGIAMLAFAGDGNGAAADPAGLAASIGGGASYAVYTVTSKGLLERGWSPAGTMGAVFGLAALASLPVLLGGDTAWLARPGGLAMALWLGLVTTTLAYLLYAAGLRSLRPPVVSTLVLAEPLTASLLGLLLLHETLVPGAWAGIGMLAAGLAVLAISATLGSRGARPATPRVDAASAASTADTRAARYAEADEARERP
ncbi:EamA family transporter [Agromyces archimandritae]|uniref:EamA family transporter n=1 Tax=Agromyces archimandritae TaxID=2781962 RepID=A0A975IPF8_9MICO|nr:EamA family transporter [Agromyces archimandritae]QTX05587.1 EamA family transporter [Agromyces archimandritae]